MMSDTILVAYATKHGSTREVAKAVAETLQERGLDVETLPAGRIADV
jgi:menaquinone-dependent protoporphyrinogen oxidase